MNEEYIPDYSTYNLHDLADAFLRIDKTNHPLKTLALYKELKSRLKLSDDIDLQSEELNNILKAIVENKEPVKSKFITVISWILIAVAALGCLSSFSMFFASLAGTSTSAINDLDGFNPVLKFVLTHLQAAFFLYFIINAGFLSSAIGLLKRQDWARIAVIAFLCLGIIWNIFGPFIMQKITPNISPSAYNMDEQQMNAIKSTSLIFSVSFGVVISIISAYVIYRLSSGKEKEEFIRNI